MNWIRFDKQLPPEDTTVMVSNGPAMGHYHYKRITHDVYCGPIEKGPLSGMAIPLWELTGQRVECKVADLVQWATLLPTPEKPKVKLTWMRRAQLWLQSLIG
jgi:hypothetical protein